MIAISNSTPRKHCGVCGCASLKIDEVAHHGRMLLAECSRCEHRWTETLPDWVRGRRVRPVRVAAAAGSRHRGRAEAA